MSYYYNVKTKKTQWNLPKPETKISIASDGNHKDQFRDKISKLVVNLLKPYLSEKCLVGHIKNNEDFKYLARKFTHTIIEKEMERATSLKELDLDNRVKIKSHEYVVNYMAKFNISGYFRKQDA